MKNPYDILHQKERALTEVLRQIAALRIVIPLLAEADEEKIFPEPLEQKTK